MSTERQEYTPGAVSTSHWTKVWESQFTRIQWWGWVIRHLQSVHESFAVWPRLYLFKIFNVFIIQDPKWPRGDGGTIAQWFAECGYSARFNIQWRQSHKFIAIVSVQYDVWTLVSFWQFFVPFSVFFAPIWSLFCSFANRFQLLCGGHSRFGATGETLGHRVVYLHHCSHN